jgi:hypothetical protein
MVTEKDPDELRDSMVCDDMPPRRWVRGLELALPQREEQTEEEADREIRQLRGRADRLVDRLRELVPDEPPPTIPEHDEGALRALCRELERRIEKASTPAQSNGWLGHRFRRRTDGSPSVCEVCAQPQERARGRCQGRPGRY